MPYYEGRLRTVTFSLRKNALKQQEVYEKIYTKRVDIPMIGEGQCFMI
jgi:hypothetical protein